MGVSLTDIDDASAVTCDWLLAIHEVHMQAANEKPPGGSNA